MQDLVRVDVPPLPSPLPARTSPRYRASPRCRPPSLRAPAAFSNFQLAPVPLLSPDHSPRPGGRRRAWLERGLRPGHHRLPRADSDKAGTVPVGAMWPRGAAATAQPKPCRSKAVPGAGLTPDVTGGAAGKRVTQRSKPRRQRRAGDLAKATAHAEGLHHCGVTSNSAIPARGATGAPVPSLLPCSQKDGASHTPGCCSSLPGAVSPQKPGCSVVPVAVLRPSLAPQQLPRVQFHASCPAPH